MPNILFAMKYLPHYSGQKMLSEGDSFHCKEKVCKQSWVSRSPRPPTSCPGMFSLPTLLLKLVSGMGLLTLTATIIDTLALYVLPDRGEYRKSVYEESPVLKQLRKERKEDKKD